MKIVVDLFVREKSGNALLLYNIVSSLPRITIITRLNNTLSVNKNVIDINNVIDIHLCQ